jgi:indolepyruvate ferredoxin oxidoreductase
VRITGIGGTGVVTVTQVLGTAAGFDGYEVRGLDQIGLSQKAGPVVGDLRLGRERPAQTSRLGRGQADLILAFDALGAASPNGLFAADPEKTAVVGSTTATPTGAMITQPGLELPSAAELCERIASATRPACRHWADAAAITTTLFGDAVTANIFVVGMAVQAGCLPIRPESIERALELNGVSIELNRAAFRWGRWQIADPEAVAAERSEHSAPIQAPVGPLTDALERTITSIADGDEPLADELRLLVSDLVAYQNQRCAEGFLETLGEVARRESSIDPASRRLRRAVASSLHKLLAYKDEYEVARLMLAGDGLAPARVIAHPGDRISWLLHPPLLRALGLKRKISVGPWARPALRLLAAGKRLRGTRFDPFGRTRMRRIERALPEEFRQVLRQLTADLKPALLDDAVAIARAPIEIRGYEDIKLASINRYRQKLAEQLERFSS